MWSWPAGWGQQPDRYSVGPLGNLTGENIFAFDAIEKTLLTLGGEVSLGGRGRKTGQVTSDNN